MKKLFKIGSENHGRGAVLFAWHPEGNLLATAGTNGMLFLVVVWLGLARGGEVREVG
jgi:hypothetical protein